MAVSRGWLLGGVLLAVVVAGAAVFLPGVLEGGATVGEPAPEFTLSDVSGNPVSLSDFSGTAVLLRFSSPTCSHCPKDYELLSQVGQRYGAVPVAVEMTASVELVNETLDSHAVDYPAVVDPSGRVAGRYGVGQLPVYYFIDAEGRLQGAVQGVPSRGEFDRYLEGEAE